MGLSCEGTIVILFRLEPPIPLETPKGLGFALFLRDYGMDHDDLWTVAITETREVWTFRNSEVRVVENATFGRRRAQMRKVEPPKLCPHGRVRGGRCAKCKPRRGETR